VLVRNPTDIILSLAHYYNSMSLSSTSGLQFSETNVNWWDWFVRTMIEQHARYHKHLLEYTTQEAHCPLYFIRYEDLIRNPLRELESLFTFLLDIDTVQNTNIQRRIA
jgi:hypothetical protein